MTLTQMITGGLTRIQEIGNFFDGLTHTGRMKEIYQLSSADMAQLYHRAADAEPLTVEHFVPAARPAATEVIHHGFNSLPAFRRFQKRFCRSAQAGSQDPAFFGYNEGATRPLLGPGYFTLRATAGLKHWERRGALVIDYFLTPDGPVAAGWPEVIPNCQGLQRLVYYQTRDFMRRVSTHVSIGTAFKNEVALGAYFVLCRAD
jgi:hypothetical protein